MMRLGDLQALAEDQARLKRATTLANKLRRLDAERAGIIAELQQLGIGGEENTEDTAAATAPIARTDRVPVFSPSAAAVAAAQTQRGAAAPLTYEDAYAEARERIIGAKFAEDTKNGAFGGDENVEQRMRDYEAHRRHDIEALAKELMAGPMAAEPCRHCDAPATTTISGDRFCDAHAATAPRQPIPAGMLH